MAEKLKIISLGGLNEIGKNMTVYEYGGDIIVIDVGMGFPDDDMYGIDVVIPDFSYLIKNKDRIRGIFLTHGHEDHIGSIPYLLRDINVPIYATRMTAGLVKLKLEEHRLLNKTKLITCEAGEVVKAGKFSVEFIHANHSIADAVCFAIKCGVGTVVHTGDFKIDPTPIQGGMMDLGRLGQLGKEGVLALLADSTNVERPGFTKSERSVGDSFDALFRGCQQRIIVTTFASNVDRIQQIIDVAARYGRKVAVTGRSMENAMKVSTELGYMNIPDGVLVDLAHIKSLPKHKICIITTGSQGETMSALTRMAFNTHRQVDLLPGDRVIISASAIPGNENAIGNVVNELYRKGVEVMNEREMTLHVSGHACQEELKIVHALVKPRFFIPVHGEQRMLQMFYVTVWGKVAESWASDEALSNLHALSGSPVLLGELLDLLRYRYEQIDFIDEPAELGFDCPLDLHCTYTRDQLLVAMDFLKPATVREGVKWLPEKQLDVFFVTLNKADKDYSPTTMYHDYSINENLFHWQSQSTTAADSPTGQRYIHHQKRGSKVLLFVREFKADRIAGGAAAYTFLGTANYVKHDGSRPMNITWKLDRPIPAKFLKKTNKLVVG